jgi:hypothetical protein
VWVCVVVAAVDSMSAEFDRVVVVNVWFVPVSVVVAIAEVTRVEFVDWSVSVLTVDVAWVVVVLFMVDERSESVLTVSFVSVLEGVVITLLVVLIAVSLVVAFSLLIV